MPNITCITGKTVSISLISAAIFCLLIGLLAPVVVFSQAVPSSEPTILLAQTDSSSSSTKSGATKAFETRKLSNPLGEANTIQEVIGRVIKIFTGLVGSLALLMFVYGGFTMMISGGDPTKVDRGKTVMKQATIGLVVIFTAYALVYMIFNALGVQGL